MLLHETVAIITGETRKADGSEPKLVLGSRRQMLPPPASKLAAADQNKCKMLPNTE